MTAAGLILCNSRPTKIENKTVLTIRLSVSLVMRKYVNSKVRLQFEVGRALYKHTLISYLKYTVNSEKIAFV